MKSKKDYTASISIEYAPHVSVTYMTDIPLLKKVVNAFVEKGEHLFPGTIHGDMDAIAELLTDEEIDNARYGDDIDDWSEYENVNHHLRIETRYKLIYFISPVHLENHRLNSNTARIIAGKLG